MTVNEFRNLALGLPEASEAEHMGHPDFRVRGKIFATLGPDEEWGMVKLTPEQQANSSGRSRTSSNPSKGRGAGAVAPMYALSTPRNHRHVKR